MNYQRFTQHAAGPLAALIGVGATSLVHHTISHATALAVATFVTSGAATYLGHAKWMDNLVHWWQRQDVPADVIPPPAVPDPGDAARADHLRTQLRAHGIEPQA